MPQCFFEDLPREVQESILRLHVHHLILTCAIEGDPPSLATLKLEGNETLHWQAYGFRDWRLMKRPPAWVRKSDVELSSP